MTGASSVRTAAPRRRAPTRRRAQRRARRASGLSKGLFVVLVAAGMVPIGPPSVPVVAAGAAAGPTAVAGGAADSCALLSGAVECWGNNAFGEVGDGTTAMRTVPTPVAGLGRVAAIASGAQHSCALLAGGTVDCWGRNNFGQLGNGSTANRKTPTPVHGLRGVRAITAGQYHTCALLSSARVDCWGYNALGQLGNGGTTTKKLPTPVAGLIGVTAIAAGALHTCARMSAGTVRCWGYNAAGQLGDGTIATHKLPVLVSGLTGVHGIAAGGSATCAVLSTKAVKCWGNNAFGQLGNGTTTSSRVPTPAAGLTGVNVVSIGLQHACAALASRTVRCWGQNSFGQLGIGSTTARLVPAAVPGLTGVTGIAAGSSHTCAVSSGVVKCWGDNGSGQLGDGTTAGHSVPRATKVRSLAAKLAALKLVNYYPHNHGWSQMWTSFDPTEISHDFGVMRAMGANSVRIIIQSYFVGWPHPSATGMGEVKKMVSLAHSHGMTAQLSLFDWFGDWSNISGSKTWADAILAPFKSDPRISFVEVRNELDVTNSAALQWAKTMVPIIHAAAGNLPVTISLPGNAPSNALQIMKQTFGKSLNFYDVHFYSDGSAAQHVFAADKATVAPSPLYVGEAGMSTGPGGSPSNPSLEQRQAKFFTQINAAARANGLGLPSPWVLQDFVDGSLTWVGSTSPEYHFGLFRVNGTAKPAYGVEKAAFGG